MPISRRRFLSLSAGGLGIASLGLGGCRLPRSPETGQGDPGRRPNIILIVTDDQRFDALGCAGNRLISTPNMDDLAARGVRFPNAFVTTPICAASRASILTGLYERTHGYTFRQPPLDQKAIASSYPSLLRRTGYRTGFVGKLGVAMAEGCIDGMFDFFRPGVYPYSKTVKGEEMHLTEINIDHAIEFLQGCDGGQPFCLSISFNAPHAEDSNPDQYVWPESCDSLYRDAVFPPPAAAAPAFFESLPGFVKESLNRERWFWRFDSPQKRNEMIKGYFRMISGIDRGIGRLRKAVRQFGLEEETIFIVMSDNGYFLGERGFAGKWTMHEPSIRIPLIISDPSLPRSRQGSVPLDMALNVDIAPTILDMAGLKAPGSMEGESLVPHLRGVARKKRSEIFCEHLWDFSKIPRTEAIRTERFKYIRYPDHPEFEELYDLAADPDEITNLAIDGRREKELSLLRKRCDRAIASLTGTEDRRGDNR